jgi:hypothetical protein
MLYAKFTRLVEEHAEFLTNKWLKEVKSHPATTGYRKIPDKILTNRLFDVYKRLGSWLLDEDPGYQKCAEHYMNLGKERENEGITISEVIYALILSRVVLWNYIVEYGLINSSLDLQHALDFYSKMNNFFDKAMYFATIGFESATNKKIKHKEEDFIEKSVNAITKWFINVKK